ncbi:hypothetical protein LX36DRAFT_123564 [Colletotrichum falcatum]|nr:hypothetical protein LX36DRAFT_123564 [Colletotrichum falcatum]
MAGKVRYCSVAEAKRSAVGLETVLQVGWERRARIDGARCRSDANGDEISCGEIGDGVDAAVCRERVESSECDAESIGLPRGTADGFTAEKSAGLRDFRFLDRVCVKAVRGGGGEGRARRFFLRCCGESKAGSRERDGNFEVWVGPMLVAGTYPMCAPEVAAAGHTTHHVGLCRSCDWTAESGQR